MQWPWKKLLSLKNVLVSCVRGYHIYKDVWEAAIGEELTCQQECRNSSNIYAVVVVKDGAVVGHCHEEFRVSLFFLRRGSTVH